MKRGFLSPHLFINRAMPPVVSSPDPLALHPSYKSPNSGGSNQFVSDRPPSITIAAPVT